MITSLQIYLYESRNNNLANLRNCARLNYKYVKPGSVDLPVGGAHWAIDQFDAFRDINMSKIVGVCVTKSACTTGDLSKMDIHYRTYGGDNTLYFVTPTATTMFFNCIVFYTD